MIWARKGLTGWHGRQRGGGVTTACFTRLACFKSPNNRKYPLKVYVRNPASSNFYQELATTHCERGVAQWFLQSNDATSTWHEDLTLANVNSIVAKNKVTMWQRFCWKSERYGVVMIVQFFCVVADLFGRRSGLDGREWHETNIVNSWLSVCCLSGLRIIRAWLLYTNADTCELGLRHLSAPSSPGGGGDFGRVYK